MKLLFFTEARLSQAKNGQFFSSDQNFSARMFQRYLSVFESVLVVARTSIAENENVDDNNRVNDAGVNVMALPYYIGPYQYLCKRRLLHKAIHAAMDQHPEAALICRVPGMIGFIAARYATEKKRCYGLEVVGDPMDVFAAGSFKHPFRAVFRYSGERNLKIAVKNATASIYVTKHFLQSRYIPTQESHSTHASDVTLPPVAFTENWKKLNHGQPYSIVAVGTLDAMYKAPDVAVDAVALLKAWDLKPRFRWVGGGRYMNEMTQRARQAGVDDCFEFVGNVASAEAVRKFLDAADLFVLPSRQEGLPRALVEAMARGLPCIGTQVGGIPELLSPLALVPVNDPQALSEKIRDFLTSPGIADAQAERNLKESRNYASAVLDAKRTSFYEHLKSITAPPPA
jgi:glycosyltransferase involved in cell wall biosynthesis